MEEEDCTGFLRAMSVRDKHHGPHHIDEDSVAGAYFTREAGECNLCAQEKKAVGVGSRVVDLKETLP